MVPCQLVARLVRPQFGQDVRFEAFLRLAEVRIEVFDRSAMLFQVVVALDRLMTQPYHLIPFVSFVVVVLDWPLKRVHVVALVEVGWILGLRLLTFCWHAILLLFALSLCCCRNSACVICGLRYHFVVTIRKAGNIVVSWKDQVMILPPAFKVPSCIVPGNASLVTVILAFIKYVSRLLEQVSWLTMWPFSIECSL